MKTIRQDLLGEAARRLAEEFHPQEIWLFGSHAWGQPDNDNDADLMVIVPNSGDRAIKRMQRAHRCLAGIGFPKGRARAHASRGMVRVVESTREAQHAQHGDSGSQRP